MYGQVHSNQVFYRDTPEPGNRFRQIVIIQGDSFQVMVVEGNVIRTDPVFFDTCSDAELFTHKSMQDAEVDAEREFQRAIQEGWQPYTPNH